MLCCQRFLYALVVVAALVACGAPVAHTSFKAAPAAALSPGHLFQQALEQTQQKQPQRAITSYQALMQAYPQHALVPLAHYNLALLLEAQHDYAQAAQHYEALLDHSITTPETRQDASFRLGLVLYLQQQYAQAFAHFQQVLQQPLPLTLHIEVLLAQGMAAQSAQQPDVAQQSFEQALGLLQHNPDLYAERPDFMAEAAFRLALLEEERFLHMPLQNADHLTLLQQSLEQQCLALLEAQRHYLMAMRAGDDRTLLLGGMHVGRMYEALHRKMNALPPPSDLNAQEAQVYAEQLQSKTQVLLHKALTIYEKAMLTAQRSQRDQPAFAELTLSVQQLKQQLLNTESLKDAVSQAEPKAKMLDVPRTLTVQ